MNLFVSITVHKLSSPKAWNKQQQQQQQKDKFSGINFANPGTKAVFALRSTMTSKLLSHGKLHSFLLTF